MLSFPLHVQQANEKVCLFPRDNIETTTGPTRTGNEVYGFLHVGHLILHEHHQLRKKFDIAPLVHTTVHHAFRDRQTVVGVHG